MSDCCGTCKYRHLYKELVDGEWKRSDCCIVLTRCDSDRDDYNSFVIKVKSDDICEMYEGREND